MTAPPGALPSLLNPRKYRATQLQVVLSSFSPNAPSQVETPTITIPAGLIPGTNMNQWRIVRYGPTGTVFAAFQADLAAAGNLEANYSGSVWQDTATDMATTQSLVRAMLQAGWSSRPGGLPGYEAIMQQTLGLAALQSSDGMVFNAGAGTLTPTIPANELIVLELGEW